MLLFHLHMCHLVIVQVGAGCERFGTDIALVWLLARVDSAMRVEGGGGGEALFANVTDMRPLPGVGANVPLQKAGAVKDLSTVRTR